MIASLRSSGENAKGPRIISVPGGVEDVGPVDNTRGTSYSHT